MMRFNRFIVIRSLCLAAMICPVISMAQSTDSIRMKGLPYGMFWENKPKAYRISKDSLIIDSGPKTDMFRDPNVTYNTDNAPKLMFRADEHFVLTANIHHAFASKWDGGALVIKTDSLNWIKFCFEKDYTGARRIVSVATNNISDDANHVASSKNAAWFKVAKADNVITLYVSDDGKKWLLVRHLQFNSSQKPLIGFLAQSPTGNNCRVTFSKIRYMAVKIKDPYAGE
ncbi:MAG TPA: DUF1349 domain-containing protein [Phnomibacter sp.]|nr:DUF1349 domain-containing protein [Phnomibacter sp.]